MRTPLESLFGKLGIEFAEFRQIRDEFRIRRLGIFRPDVNGALKRLGTEQLFNKSRAVFQRLFRIFNCFRSYGLETCDEENRRGGRRLELLFANSLKIRNFAFRTDPSLLLGLDLSLLLSPDPGVLLGSGADLLLSRDPSLLLDPSADLFLGFGSSRFLLDLNPGISSTLAGVFSLLLVRASPLVLAMSSRPWLRVCRRSSDPMWLQSALSLNQVF